MHAGLGFYSPDLDGVDNWAWNAIDVMQQRVVVVEFNAILVPELAVTVSYNPRFTAEFTAFGSECGGIAPGTAASAWEDIRVRFVPGRR